MMESGWRVAVNKAKLNIGTSTTEVLVGSIDWWVGVIIATTTVSSVSWVCRYRCRWCCLSSVPSQCRRWKCDRQASNDTTNKRNKLNEMRTHPRYLFINVCWIKDAARNNATQMNRSRSRQRRAYLTDTAVVVVVVGIINRCRSKKKEVEAILACFKLANLVGGAVYCSPVCCLFTSLPNHHHRRTEIRCGCEGLSARTYEYQSQHSSSSAFQIPKACTSGAPQNRISWGLKITEPSVTKVHCTYVWKVIKARKYLLATVSVKLVNAGEQKETCFELNEEQNLRREGSFPWRPYVHTSGTI